MKINTPKQTITKKSEILSFGKYKDRTIRFILTTEASYILWLDKNEIVEFEESIIEDAEQMSADQHKVWLKDNYGDANIEDWGDKD